MNTRLYEERILDLNADCCEFCPGPPHDLLAVGTYALDESTRQRNGQLLVYHLITHPQPQLQLRCCQSLPGVFDAKWWRQPGSGRYQHVSLALADGSLTIYGVPESEHCGGATSSHVRLG
jgi:hypothetical protein